MKKNTNSNYLNFFSNSSFLIFLLSMSIFAFISIFIFLKFKYKPIYTTVEIVVTAPNWWLQNPVKTPYWLTNSITIGDKDKNNETAIILDKKIVELTGGVDDYYQSKKYEISQDVYLKVRLKTTQKDGQILYNDRPIQVGSPIELSLQKSYISGLITEIPSANSFEELKQYQIKGILESREKFETQLVKEGMNYSLNSIELLRIDHTQLLPSQMVTVDDRGNVYVKSDPLRFDILLDLTMMVSETQNKLLFQRYQEIKVGNYLNLYTNSFNLMGLKITDIKKI